ncbi:M56 family metallopeptidase [Cytobacillus sp. Hm23]
MDVQYLFTLVIKMTLLGSIMAGLIFVIKKGLHNKMSAHWHYYIWLLLIGRLIIPYSYEASVLFPDIDSDLKSVDVVEFEEAVTSNQTSTIEIQETNNVNEKVSMVISSEEEKIVPNKSFKEILSIIWVTGAIITLLVMLLANIHFHWRLSKKQKCDDYELLTLLEECMTQLKIHTKVQIIYNESIGTPSVVGSLRPKILINKSMLNTLSRNETKFVLLHELTHVKRRDILIQWLAVFTQAIHWFNPIIWYSFYTMRKDCEISCDASVLSKLKRAEHIEYGTTLLTVIEKISKPTVIPRSIGMSTSRSHIKLRLEKITMFKKQSWKWIFLSSMFVVAIILSGSMTFTKASSNHLIDIYENLNTEKGYEYSRGENWEDIKYTIDMGLKEIEELKVTSTTILSYYDPIIVNTEINISDPIAKEVDKKIKQLINEFFEYEPISDKFSGPTDVIVRSKEDKLINKQNEWNSIAFPEQEVNELQKQVDQGSNALPLFIDLKSNEYVDKKDLDLIKGKIMNLKLQNGDLIYEIFNEKFSNPTWTIASLNSTVLHFTGSYNGNEYKIDFLDWNRKWLNISIDNREINEVDVHDYFDNLVEQLTNP